MQLRENQAFPVALLWGGHPVCPDRTWAGEDTYSTRKWYWCLERTRLNYRQFKGCLPMNCPDFESQKVIKRGSDTLKDGTQLQRYRCKDCGKRFNERSLSAVDLLQHLLP
jgi:hypothetical protein